MFSVQRSEPSRRETAGDMFATMHGSIGLMKRQEGQVLAGVLAVIAVGTLLIAPFLSQTRVSLRSSRDYTESKIQQSSADSGVEHAMWDLTYGTLASQFTIPGDQFTYQLGEAVNELTPQVTVTMTSSGTGGGGDSGEIADPIAGSLEFDTSQTYEPDMIAISGNIYAIAYRGPNDDGFVKTVEITQEGQVTESVIDTMEFETSYCVTPNIISVSGDVYAIAYRGPGNDGFVTTVQIASDGQITDSPLDTFEFDTSQGLEPSILHVSGNAYAIAYCGPGNDGFLKTVEIASDGEIGAAILDSYEFDLSYCRTPDLIHISGTSYAIAYRGPDNDGFVRTIQIAANGEIIGPVFDAIQGFDPAFIPISGSVHAIVYRGADDDGFIKTIEMSPTGQILNLEIDSLEFDVSDGYEPSVINVSGDVYAVAYRGPGTDGYLKTVEITSEGEISDSVIDSLEFDTSQGYEPCIVHVSGDIYAIAYRGPGSDGYLKTVQIAADGQIGADVIDSLEFDTAYCVTPEIMQISGDTFAIAYRGPGNDGYLKTVEITSNGYLPDPEFDTSQAYEPVVIHVSGDIYAVAYRGPDNDGFVKTLLLTDMGQVTIDTLEYDTSQALQPDIVNVSGDVYAIAYRGTGDDGFVTAVEIASDGQITDSVIDTLEFETSYCITPDIIQVSTDVFAIAYRGPGNDGFITTIEIAGTGQITDSVVDSYEFDAIQGVEPRILYVDHNVYAIAYRGADNDGFVMTLEITDDGHISDPRFDPIQGYEPRIVHVSGDVYAIAYRGADNDGFLKTVRLSSEGRLVDLEIDAVEFDAVEAYTPSVAHVSGDVFAIAYRGPDGDGFLKTFEITSGGTIGASALDTLEFDTTQGYEPDIVHVSGDIYAIAYRGPGNDGYLVTVETASNGQITDTVIDTFEFETSYCVEPDIVNVSGGTFAIAYRGPGDNGFIRTVRIAADGNIVEPEYDSTEAYEPDMIHVAGDVYGIAYRGTGNKGFIRTVAISAAGTVSAAPLDTLEFDSAAAYEPDINHISGDVYAVAYRGPDADGFLKTVRIGSNGLIETGAIDTLEFDTASGYEPDMVHISGDVYAVAYRGAGNDGWVKTLEIVAAGTITDTVIDSIEFEPSYCVTPDIAHVSGEVYAIAYRGPDNDGFVTTVEIAADGQITDPHFDGSYAYEADIVHVSSDVFAVAYRGPDSDGFLKTVRINADGTYSSSALDTLEFDTTQGYEPDIVHISGDIYAVAYRGPGNDGYVTTVQIMSSGDIADTAVDTLEFDASFAATPDLVNVSGDIYAIAYRGPGSDGFVTTVEIASNGQITDALIDTMEFETSRCYDPSIIQVASDMYAVAYRGPDDDGFAVTVEIASDGQITDSIEDLLEFDAVYCVTPDLVFVQGNVYAVVYRGPDNDGFTATMRIQSNGNISNSTLDSMEFDASAGYEPRIIGIAGDVFAIAYRGPGNDGWLATVEIGSSGNIADSPIDSFEFDASYCVAPDIVPVSGDVFAIAYTGNTNYGYLETVEITSDGLISAAVVTSFEFETDYCVTPDIVNVTGDIYAIAYRGPDNDGFVKTVQISFGGEITNSALDTLEFDPAQGIEPVITHVSGTVCAVAYRGSGNDGFAASFGVAADGQISDAVIDSLEFDLEYCVTPSMLNVSGDVHAIAYRGTGNIGALSTIAIAPDGQITDALETLFEFDATYCVTPDIIHQSGDVYAVAYRGSGTLGYLSTVEIESSGQITQSTIDTLVFDSSRGLEPSLVQVSGTVCAVAYQGDGSDGYVTTIGIDADGRISDSVIDTFEFDELYCSTPDMLNLSDDIYGIAYRGDGSAGFMAAVEIASNGMIAYAIPNIYEFETDYCVAPDIINTSGDIYAIAYRGPGNDGFVKTIGIATDGEITPSVLDVLEFDASDTYDPDLVHVSGTVYAVAYRGSGNDGFVASMDIAADGQIGDSVIDRLEFDTSYCVTPDIFSFSGDTYTIAYRGPGNDGFVRNVDIAANGEITETVVTSYEFDTSYCITPDIINISGDVYGIAYRGPGNDGFLKTVEIAANGDIAQSVIDTLEWDTAQGIEPDIVNVTGDVYAIAYRGTSNDGFVRTVAVAADGQITDTVIDSFEFDEFYCVTPDMVNTSGSAYTVAYRGTDNTGMLSTLSITAEGEISLATVTSFEFDAVQAYEPDIDSISGDVYAVAYRGADDDGYVKTLEILSDGTITESVIDSFEFETSRAIEPDMVPVSGEVFAIVYRGNGDDGFVSTVEVAADGGITDYVLDVLEFEDSYCSTPDMLGISGDIYGIAYRGPSNDGFLKTVQIDAAGEITMAVVVTYEFDTSQVYEPDLVHVSGDTYACAYRGPANHGVLKTVRIGSDGQITVPELDTIEFDASYCVTPDIIHVSGSVFAIAYRGPDSDGFLKTIEIAGDGTIGTALDTLEFDTSSGYEPDIVHVSDDVYAIAYRGSGSDGFVTTVDIAGDGTIGGVVDTLEFDASSGYEPDIIHVSGNIYAIAYRGSGNDGYLKTVEVDAAGQITGSVIDTLEFDTSYCVTPSIVDVWGDVYAVAYRGSGNHGFVKTLDIGSNGQISGTVIDTLEFEGSNAYEPVVIEISCNAFAVAYRGDGNDGFLKTIEIMSSGEITDTVIDFMEFDDSFCATPSMLHVSQDTYAIAYRGPGSDGYLKTIQIATAQEDVDRYEIVATAGDETISAMVQIEGETVTVLSWQVQ